MKYLLILGLLFTVWQAFGYERVKADGCIAGHYEVFNALWYESFFRDLNKRVERLAEQAGGVDYVNVEDLRPRQSFTKPHRVHLLSRLKKHYDSPYHHSFLDEKEDIGGYEFNNEVNTHNLIARKQQEYILKMFEFFGISTDQFFTPGGCPSGVIVHSSYDNYPNVDLSIIKSEVLGGSEWYFVNWIEITPEVRWWFNDNIKPILEDIIMLHDLVHGEYEPY